MARLGHQNRENKNTHTQMAKVVYATTDGQNVGFNTSWVKVENVEEELEKRRQQYKANE